MCQILKMYKIGGLRTKLQTLRSKVENSASPGAKMTKPSRVNGLSEYNNLLIGSDENFWTRDRENVI